MQKAGERLKNVRQEKGYSIEEVSKKTKISSSILRALEEGRLDNINPVYLRGFLKLYCRFLGLDWETFIKEYSLSAPIKVVIPKSASAAKETESQETQKRAPSFVFLKKNKKIIRTIVLAIAALLLITVFLKGLLFIIKKFPKVRPAAKQSSSRQVTPKKSSPTVNAKEKPQATQPPPSKVTKVAPPQQTPVRKDAVSKTVVLVVRAKDDSFLKVKVDGQMVYQSALRRGRAETWTAKEKIELSVGNAGGLVLEVNGKIFSSLGRSGQSIKNILITSEGLKIL